MSALLLLAYLGISAVTGLIVGWFLHRLATPSRPPLTPRDVPYLDEHGDMSWIDVERSIAHGMN
jgi:hypothetical protein